MGSPLNSNEESLSDTSESTDQSDKFYCWVLFPHVETDGKVVSSKDGASFGGIFNDTDEGWPCLEQTIREFCEDKNRSPAVPIESIDKEQPFNECPEGREYWLPDQADKPLVGVIQHMDPTGDVTKVLKHPKHRSLHQVRTIRYDGDESKPQEFPIDEDDRWWLVAPRITPGYKSFDLGVDWTTFAFREDLGKYADEELKRLGTNQRLEWMHEGEVFWVYAILEEDISEEDVPKDILKRIVVSTEWTHDEITRKWIQSDIWEIISPHIDEDVARNVLGKESSKDLPPDDLLPEHSAPEDASPGN